MPPGASAAGWRIAAPEPARRATHLHARTFRPLSPRRTIGYLCRVS